MSAAVAQAILFMAAAKTFRMRRGLQPPLAFSEPGSCATRRPGPNPARARPTAPCSAVKPLPAGWPLSTGRCHHTMEVVYRCAVG